MLSNIYCSICGINQHLSGFSEFSGFKKKIEQKHYIAYYCNVDFGLQKSVSKCLFYLSILVKNKGDM